MLRDGVAVGIDWPSRAFETGPFTDSQIDLLKTFADQAVIAIENTRLFEAEQRAAPSSPNCSSSRRRPREVLNVISSSPAELEPVFNAMLECALRICEAKFGMLMLYRDDDGSFDTRVMVGAPPALVDALLHTSFKPPPGNPLDRMLRTKKAVHVVDAAAENAKPVSAQLAGARSHISVPMVKETTWSAPSRSIEPRFAPLPTSRSNW